MPFFLLALVLSFLAVLSRVHGAVLLPHVAEYDPSYDLKSTNITGADPSIHLVRRAPTAESLFSIRAEDEDGGCSATQIALITSWLAEIVLLHNAVISALQVTDTADLMHLVFIMGIKLSGGTISNTDMKTAIDNRVAVVTKFLSGYGIPSAASGDPNPYIFCTDAFATYQPWNQPAKNSEGKEITYETADGETEAYTLKQIFVDEADSDMLLPFWIDLFKGYDFDVNGYTSGLCGMATLYAVTSFTASTVTEDAAEFKTGNVVRHITLCPRVWTPLEAHNVETLASLITYDGYPTAKSGVPIDYYMTRSLTLYHELYHLTDTEDDGTADPFKSTDAIFAAAAFEGSNEQIARNPESYAVFALASYLYRHPPETTEGSTDKPAVVWKGVVPYSIAQLFGQA